VGVGVGTVVGGVGGGVGRTHEEIRLGVANGSCPRQDDRMKFSIAKGSIAESEGSIAKKRWLRAWLRGRQLPH
jgi:hypothetical protein